MILLAVCSVVAAPCVRAPVTDGSQPAIPADNAAEAPLLPRTADALPTMNPQTFDRLLRQLRGTPVLVNVWGSWCPPCREEMPRIVAAHGEFGERVQFLGIDILDSRSEARSFIEEFGMTFPSVFDPPDAIKDSLGQIGQPVTMFFRSDGTFSFSWSGPIAPDVLRTHLRAILR